MSFVMIFSIISWGTFIESKAAGNRTYGNYTRYTVHIDSSSTSVIPDSSPFVTFNRTHTSDNTFPVYQQSGVNYLPETGLWRKADTFDFYRYSGSEFFTPDLNASGYQIDISNISGTYKSSNIGSLSVVIGSNASIAGDNCVSVINQPFASQSGTRLFVPISELSGGAWFWWVHGSACLYEYRFDLHQNTSSSVYPTYDIDITFTANVRPYYDSYASSGDIQQSTDAIKKGNELQKEANETSKGIFSSLKDFFGSFFSNLINSVISLFVPSSDEMSALFDQLNQFFSDRFGFLYAPFDYMVRLCGVFTSSTGSTSLTFPGFSIMGEQVWPDMSYDLASDELVGTILGYVRTGTGILLAGYFIMYLQGFFKERFGSG